MFCRDLGCVPGGLGLCSAGIWVVFRGDGGCVLQGFGVVFRGVWGCVPGGLGLCSAGIWVVFRGNLRNVAAVLLFENGRFLHRAVLDTRRNLEVCCTRSCSRREISGSFTVFLQ